MNDKYKNVFKKIGIAGFFFFLLKGILWLVLGSSLYKWLKELLLVSVTTAVPFLSEAQSSLVKPRQFEFSYSIPVPINKPKLWIDECKIKPFFCRLEDQLNENKKTYIKFRLGSLEYSNELEYSKSLDKKEAGNIFLR